MVAKLIDARHTHSRIDTAAGTTIQCPHARPSGPIPMLAKLVVVAIFVGVLASLASALLFLVKDKGRTERTVRALSMRVGISIGLLCLLVLLWALGLIQPHGIRP